MYRFIIINNKIFIYNLHLLLLYSYIQGVMSAGGYVCRGLCPQGVLFRVLYPQGVLSAGGYVLDSASSACKQLAINISVTLRHTGQYDQFNYCNNKLLSVWLLWIPTVMKTFISTKGYNETMHICIKIKILSCSGIYLNIPRFEDFFLFSQEFDLY